MIDPASSPYYRHHIFFCINDRGGDQESCTAHGAETGFDHCKQAVKAAGLLGVGGVRVNKSSCLNRCAGGPVAVVYPEGIWYTFIDKADIDEIVKSHLEGGKVVKRLVLAPDVGK
jgi:(2Fe-2S) ferredoxin